MSEENINCKISNPITKPTKVCSRCQEEKPVVEFGKQKDTKDGLRSQCKGCRKESGNNNKGRLLQEHQKHQLENPIEEKTCSCCKIKKSISEFCKGKNYKDGFMYICKSCCKIINKQWHLENKEEANLKNKQWRSEHIEEIKLRDRQDYLENREEILLKNKIWRLEHKEELKISGKQNYLENREEILLDKKQYYLENDEEIKLKTKQRHLINKEKDNLKGRLRYFKLSPEDKKKRHVARNKWHKHRVENDIIYRTSCRCRTMVSNALNGQPKKAHTMEYFMCSNQFFMKYIESLWLPGMTWKNRGRGLGKWQIDHIIPISFFNMTDEVEKYMCCRYQNLQPLWWEDNMKKNDKTTSAVQNLK